MGLNRAEIVAQAQALLGDTDETWWAEEDLEAICDNVVSEISKRESKLEYSYLPILEDTKRVDISGLTGLVDIVRTEWPYGDMPPSFRNFTIKGDYLELRLATEPTISQGTLTGSVAFVKDSATVTGTGTNFSSVLQVGYFIRVSSGTYWYRIMKVTSNTQLTLEITFKETSVPANTNTVYRDAESCVGVHWGGIYTVADASSDMPSKFDEIPVQGVVAKAALQFAGSKCLTEVDAAVGKIGDANTAIADVVETIGRAIEDLDTTREDVEANLGTFAEEIALMAEKLTQAATYLTESDSVINTVTHGDQVPQSFAEYSRSILQTALGHLEKSRGFLESSNISKIFIDSAKGELENAAAYIAKAGNYLSQAAGHIDVGRLTATYRIWAEEQMQQYQAMLRGLGRIEDGIEAVYPTV
jgi:hypothetical protein